MIGPRRSRPISLARGRRPSRLARARPAGTAQPTERGRGGRERPERVAGVPDADVAAAVTANRPVPASQRPTKTRNRVAKKWPTRDVSAGEQRGGG
jgi:hypothetical protein